MTRALQAAVTGLAVGLLVMIAALELGGGSPQPALPGIPDAGPLVGWALPATTYLVRLAAVAVTGFLVAAVFLMPTGKDVVEGLSVSAVGLASRWAAVWSVASLVLFFLTMADVFATPLSGLSSTSVTSFAFEASVGRALLVQAVVAAVLAVACRWTIGVRPLAVWAGVSLAALLPVSLTGHSASAGSHDLATTSLFR